MALTSTQGLCLWLHSRPPCPFSYLPLLHASVILALASAVKKVLEYLNPDPAYGFRDEDTVSGQQTQGRQLGVAWTEMII